MSKYTTYMDWNSTRLELEKNVDYGFILTIESLSMLLVGMETMNLQVNEVSGEGTLSWNDLKVYSPLTGKTIIISNTTVAVADGDIIYIEAVGFPIKDSTRVLKAAPGGSKTVRVGNNVFIGVRSGDRIILRGGAGGGASAAPSVSVDAFIPIEDGVDALSGNPAALENYVPDGNGGRVRMRRYDYTSEQKLVFPWEAPIRMNAGDPITFQVVGVVPQGDVVGGVLFCLDNFTVTDKQSMRRGFNSPQTVQKELTGYVSGERFETEYSPPLTVLGLAPGRQVQWRLTRQVLTPDEGGRHDTYDGVVGVVGIKIRYQFSVEFGT